MDKGEYAELQEQFEELQRQYDELRIVVARAGIPLPPEERKRPTLTIIKGGLAAIVGLLAWMFLRSKHHRVVATALSACVLTGAGVGVWTAMAPPTPRVHAMTVPSRHGRRRPASRHVARHVATPSVRPVASASPHATQSGRRVFPELVVTPTPAPSVSPPQTQPQPQPTVPPPTPKPHPSHTPKPHPSPAHTRKCLVWAIVLGVKVCVKFS